MPRPFLCQYSSASTCTKTERGQETQRLVYLDNNASTRMDPEVLAAMLPFLQGEFANPSSAHSGGGVQREAIDAARQSIQRLLRAGRAEEIVFTSGGTESNNTAILSALETQYGRDEVVVSAIEHPSILACCAHLERTGRAKIVRVPVNCDGETDVEAYRKALSQRTAIASIQWANNEVGVIQRVRLLAELAHQTGALFHCDAVQAAGRIPVDVNAALVDLLSISAHKFHGPKGIGALYVRHGIPFSSLLRGGRQERGRRAGTENVAAICGFGKAAELAQSHLLRGYTEVAQMRDLLEHQIHLRVPSAITIGSRKNRIPNTLCIAFDEIEGDDLVILLDRQGIAVSSGAACSSGGMEPSHVMRALRVPFSHIRGAVRFSLSRGNTLAEICRVVEVLPQALQQLRESTVGMEGAYGD